MPPAFRGRSARFATASRVCRRRFSRGSRFRHFPVARSRPTSACSIKRTDCRIYRQSKWYCIARNRACPTRPSSLHVIWRANWEISPLRPKNKWPRIAARPLHSSFFSGDLLRPHVLTFDPGDDNGLLHRVAAERLAELLIEQDFDEGGLALLLRFASILQRLRQLLRRLHGDALQAAALRDFCVAQMRIELGADKIVVVPENRMPLFRAPLIVAEDDHRNARPLLAADRAHFVHGDAEGTVAREADARHVGVADLRANDRWKAVTAWAEQAGSEIFPAFLESRVSVADGAVVADIARDDGVARQAGLDRAPRLTRRHAVAVTLARFRIPVGARIVFLVIHAGKRLQPFGFR